MAHCKEKASATLSRIAGIFPHWHPYLDCRIEGMFEARGHHANNAVGLAVEDQLLRFKIPVAVQTFLPHLFVDDYQLRCAFLVFAVRKSAPGDRREIENFEEICRNERAPNAVGSLAASYVDRSEEHTSEL